MEHKDLLQVEGEGRVGANSSRHVVCSSFVRSAPVDPGNFVNHKIFFRSSPPQIQANGSINLNIPQRLMFDHNYLERPNWL